VTELSTHFINFPPDQVDHGIIQALARLGDYTGVDRAYILLFGADGRSLDRSHAWRRAGMQTPVGYRGDLLRAEFSSSLERFVRHGSIHVPSVCALPSTPERTSLAERGSRSWLAFPCGARASGSACSASMRCRPKSDGRTMTSRCCAHIGARIAALALPGEVLVSSTVKNLVAGAGAAFAHRGAHTLKGVPNQWEVFAASLPGRAAG
jgi:hypothetical protein